MTYELHGSIMIELNSISFKACPDVIRGGMRPATDVRFLQLKNGALLLESIAPEDRVGSSGYRRAVALDRACSYESFPKFTETVAGKCV